MMRTGHGIRRTKPALALILACVFAVAAGAQSRDANSSGEGSSANPQRHPRGLAGQLAKETREAAGEEDEQNHFKHSASVQLVARLTGLSLDHAYWLCVVLNFAIVAGVIFWVSRTRLPGAFRNRTLAIQKAMQEARQASEDANRRLAGIEARLSKLDAEIAAMRVAAEKEAAAEEARIQAAAGEDARKIAQAAEEEIAAAIVLARRELTAHAADLAVSLAGRQIKLDPATDQGLVRSFVQHFPADSDGGATGRGDGR